MLVTIFGGGGFVGRYVAQELLAKGFRVRIAERNPGDAMRVKPLGGLGQTQLVHADVTDAASVARAVAGAGAVVNLVALLDGNLDAVNHLGAANVAQAAAQASISSLVHISAIGADVNSDSAYGRSKGEGEAAVRAAVPDAVILRPSIIFGREDQFTNRFANMARMMPILPVLAPDTRFQPVYVADVARSVAAVLADAPAFVGKTFELGGPQVMTMLEINRFIAERAGQTPMILPTCTLFGSVMAMLPLSPITSDQWKMLGHDNVVAAGASGLADLGVAATPLAAVADNWLVSYRKHGRFSRSAKA